MLDQEWCEEESHRHCIWYKHDCPIDGVGGSYEDFDDWLGCYEDYVTVECGPWGEEHFECYWDGMGCDDYEWYNCYWYEECGSQETDWDATFDDWLDCWLNTYDDCSYVDPYDTYYNCYYYGDYCEDSSWYDCYWYGIDCEDPFWFDCYWYDYNCDMTGDAERWNDFDEWLYCYESTYDTCGARHSEHYDCYWYNENCRDAAWHDCYWYGDDCDRVMEFDDDLTEDYIGGYFEGYELGYEDGIIDTRGPDS